MHDQKMTDQIRVVRINLSTLMDKSSAVAEMAEHCCVCHFLLANNTNRSYLAPFPTYFGQIFASEWEP